MKVSKKFSSTLFKVILEKKSGKIQLNFRNMVVIKSFKVFFVSGRIGSVPFGSLPESRISGIWRLEGPRVNRNSLNVATQKRLNWDKTAQMGQKG